MLRQIDEYDLLRAQPTRGIYAFHLRLIRAPRAGLTGTETPEELVQVRDRLLLLVRRVADFETASLYSGNLGELGAYGGHGRYIELSGSSSRPIFLEEQIAALSLADVPGFVRALDALSAFFPPLYVGIAIRQTVQARYRQHQRDYENGPADRTFGSRVAKVGLEWTDLVYSYAPQETLRLSDSAISQLENYIQFLSRPRLGKS